jgi:hypothetical protein
MTRTKQISLLVAAALATNAGFAAAAQGPSSSATPYVTPTAAGWDVTSILTVGDAAMNGYQMVGIPDGLGSFDNNDGTFTVLMNHELGLGTTAGVTRAHGSKGAFVSQWVINKSDLKVISGRDMIQSANDVNTWNGSAWVKGTTSFARLCSADLAAKSAFYNSSTGKGYNGQLFMNGEETGAEGRAFAFVATGAEAGQAYETPYLGKFSWENSLANPYSGDKTVVIGTDDSTPGQVYMYVGNKQTTGNAVEQAGLHNGQLYGIKVNGVATESGAINGTFTLQSVNANQTGTDLNTQSNSLGVTNFARPEDGHWADADTFYFVTTGATVNGVANSSKLYRLDYTDANDLTLGGTITMVQDSATLIGSDGFNARTFDNMVVGGNGVLYIQEDPGNSQYNAKTWMYDPVTNQWTQILMSDVSRFGSSDGSILASAPFNRDEESSGIIEVTSILGKNDGKRYFLADMQAHYGIAGQFVEGGQLYMISAPVPEPETYAMLLGGLGLLGFAARRNRK